MYVLTLLAATLVDANGQGEYLMGFQTISGVIGPQVPIPAQRQERHWEKLLRSADELAEQGHLQKAVEAYRSINSNDFLRKRMGDAGGYLLRISLGRTLLQMHVLEHAILLFAEASSMQKDNHVAHFYLGLARSKQGRLDDGIIHYKNCLFFNPQHLEALCNLGSLLLIKGQINEGLHYYRSALRFRNMDMDNLMELMNITQHDDNQLYGHFIEHVLECISSKLKGGSWSNVEAFATLERFLEMPSHNQFTGRMHFDFGIELQKVGLMQEGKKHMLTGWRMSERQAYMWVFTMQVSMALQFPLVPSSIGARDDALKQLSLDIEELQESAAGTDGKIDLLNDDGDLDDDESSGTTGQRQYLDENEIYSTCYQLPNIHYASSSTVTVAKVAEEIGRVYSQLTPVLSNVSTMVQRIYQEEHAGDGQEEHAFLRRSKVRSSSLKVRVGIVSGHFWKPRIAQMLIGLVSRLPRSKFIVVVYHLPSPLNNFTQALGAAADFSRHLPFNMSAQREIFASYPLDVLLFPDTLLSDVQAYFLAHSRLAAVQATIYTEGWTTGLPWSVDYHVTSAFFGAAVPSAAEHFNEQIVLLGDECAGGIILDADPPTGKGAPSHFGHGPEDTSLLYYR
jgi:tetratricopeptide (TPR) repeat protein